MVGFSHQYYYSSWPNLTTELHGKYGVPKIDARRLEPLEWMAKPVGEGKFAEVFEVTLVADGNIPETVLDNWVSVYQAFMVRIC